MSFVYRYRKIIWIMVFVLFLLTGGGVFCYFQFFQSKPKSSTQKIVLSNKKEEPVKKQEEEKSKETTIQVDIKGEVVHPGLYSVLEGKRVSDVIELAGGITEQGDTTVINLSKKVVDEMVIIIYSKEQVSHFEETKKVEEEVINQCIHSSTLSNDACINEDNSTQEESLISINQATKEELSTLTGIGESKAENIIQYREEHGEFTDINQLKEVTGIGESIFDQIKDHICL